MDRKIFSVVNWKKLAWEVVWTLFIVPASFICMWHVVLHPWGIKDLQLLQGFSIAVIAQAFHARYIE